MRWFRDLLATWFGSGLAPFASGTVGTIAALPLVALLTYSTSPLLHAASGGVLFFAGVWSSSDAEERWGKKDPGQVVLDEVAAFVVLTAVLPRTAPAVAIAFFTFRFFDVLKPWPASALERLPRGWGIMADDIAAAAYAAAVSAAALWAWSHLG